MASNNTYFLDVRSAVAADIFAFCAQGLHPVAVKAVQHVISFLHSVAVKTQRTTAAWAGGSCEEKFIMAPQIMIFPVMFGRHERPFLRLISLSCFWFAAPCTWMRLRQPPKTPTAQKASSTVWRKDGTASCPRLATTQHRRYTSAGRKRKGYCLSAQADLWRSQKCQSVENVIARSRIVVRRR